MGGGVRRREGEAAWDLIVIIFLQFKRFLSTFELHSTLSIVVMAFVKYFGIYLVSERLC